MKDTPLQRAAHNGHLQTVRFLVENGADVVLKISVKFNFVAILSVFCVYFNFAFSQLMSLKAV